MLAVLLAGTYFGRFSVSFDAVVVHVIGKASTGYLVLHIVVKSNKSLLLCATIKM